MLHEIRLKKEATPCVSIQDKRRKANLKSSEASTRRNARSSLAVAVWSGTANSVIQFRVRSLVIEAAHR
jgi:hypothetical protein